VLRRLALLSTRDPDRLVRTFHHRPISQAATRRPRAHPPSTNPFATQAATDSVGSWPTRPTTQHPWRLVRDPMGGLRRSLTRRPPCGQLWQRRRHQADATSPPAGVPAARGLTPTRRAYGFHSPDSLIAMAMLTRGGLFHLFQAGKATHENVRRPQNPGWW